MIKIKKIAILSILAVTMVIPTSVYANSKETNHVETHSQDKKHDVKSSLDGQIIYVKYKQGRKDSETIKSLKTLSSLFATPCYNEFNDKITGKYEFSITPTDIIFGYNYIDYTFTPIKSYAYNETSGSFTIINEIIPRILTSSSKIYIDLDNIEDYNIFVDKQLVNDNVIKNLNQKTNYTIEIYQKANENLKEDTLLYETTVTTKSK